MQIKIHKEVKQKNRFIGKLDMKQAIIAFIVIAIEAYIMFNYWDAYGEDALVYSGIFLGIPAYILGWYSPHGVDSITAIKMKIQKNVFKNGKRPYRTKNNYVNMMNKKYAAIRMEKAKDKNYQKELKKQNKNKKQVKSSITPIY